MFSDRYRWLKIIFCLALISGLVFYAEIVGPQKIPGLAQFKKIPDIFIGKELEFNGSLQEIGPSYFLVNQKLDGKLMKVKIQGRLEKAKTQDTIYVVAEYQKDRTLVLKRYLISNSRPIKIAISLVAFLWVIFYFLKNFTFDFKNLIFEPKFMIRDS